MQVKVKKKSDEVVEEGWKNWAMAGALGAASMFNPQTANAQSAQNWNSANKWHSAENTIRLYNQKYTIKDLIQMFPQAYVDKNATPEVWMEHAREGKYTPSVRDEASGKYREFLVAYIAGKNGQNPWEALVKRYCPEEDGKTFKIGDF